MDRYLTPNELSDTLGIPISTLYKWRVKGEGPRGIRVGRHVRYAAKDVDAWLAGLRDQERAAI